MFKLNVGTGEMFEQLRALTVLPENSQLPVTLAPRDSNTVFWPLSHAGVRMHTYGHTCIPYIHTNTYAYV